MHDRWCAGLDVHKASVVACVRLPGPNGTRVSKVETFGTTTVDLLALRDWLEAWGVTDVAMESAACMEASLLPSGGPLHVLSRQRRAPRACARSQERGEGRGVIAQCLECGLLRASFVPPPPFAICAT